MVATEMILIINVIHIAPLKTGVAYIYRRINRFFLKVTKAVKHDKNKKNIIGEELKTDK